MVGVSSTDSFRLSSTDSFLTLPFSYPYHYKMCDKDFYIRFDIQEDGSHLLKIHVNKSISYWNEWTGHTKLFISTPPNGINRYCISGKDEMHPKLSFLLHFNEDSSILEMSLGNSSLRMEMAPVTKQNLMSYIKNGTFMPAEI